MFQHMIDLIHTDKGTYYISTNDTPDMGLETMVFKCKKKYPKTRNDIDWDERYTEHHNNINDAVKRHNEIKDNIEEYIKER